LVAWIARPLAGDLATISKAVGRANPNVTTKVYAHALGTPEEQAERVAVAAAAAGLGHEHGTSAV